MYTRKDLCDKFGLSLATVRRLLQLLSIQPCQIKRNAKDLPIFYYNQSDIQLLQKHIIQAAQYKRIKRKKCCICKQLLAQQLLIDSRCIDCYIQKYCKPLIFGNKPWRRLLNIKLVDKAINYLNTIKQSAK